MVYGATSFVGQIITHYMAEQYGCDNLRWAIAGRSMAKLTDLKQSLGSSAGNLALLNRRRERFRGLDDFMPFDAGYTFYCRPL